MSKWRNRSYNITNRNYYFYLFLFHISTIFFYIPEIVRECLQRFEQELLIPKALVVAGRLLWLLNKVDGFDFQELESKNKKINI